MSHAQSSTDRSATPHARKFSEFRHALDSRRQRTPPPGELNEKEEGVGECEGAREKT